ncbi:MAG: hypothetical protein LBV46_00955 [Bacteroidales bacterium]|jgi:hypothetical protein|nr:hypothetical protein [Bacteroidales bacterium]
MKKTVQILLVLLATAAIAIGFSECKKDETCKVKITCYYSENGIDTGTVAPDCTVELGREEYPPIPNDLNGPRVPAVSAQAEGVTNMSGVYEHTFELEALLDIKAKATVQVYDSTTQAFVSINYIGLGQVKLIPGETVTKSILVIRQN